MCVKEREKRIETSTINITTRRVGSILLPHEKSILTWNKMRERERMEKERKRKRERKA